MTAHVIVTGSDGFIAGEVVRQLRERFVLVHGLDAGTYAAAPEQHDPSGIPGFVSGRVDCTDLDVVRTHLSAYHVEQPITHVIHAAAHTHVDRSIHGPIEAFRTNALGTAVMLEATRQIAPTARFVYVSTDEVFGERASDNPAERDSVLKPSSAYSAGKAAGEHACHAYLRTYGTNVAWTRGPNTCGAWQHPEKFVPTVVRSLLAGEPVPLYGDGMHRRIWVTVEDHARAIIDTALDHTVCGARMLAPPWDAISNLEVVQTIAYALKKPAVVRFVADRMGHDRCYAMTGSHDWVPLRWDHLDNAAVVEGVTWCGAQSALARAAQWYAEHADWMRGKLDSPDWREYHRRTYGE